MHPRTGRSFPEPLPSLPPFSVEDLGRRAYNDDDDDSPRPETASSPNDFQRSKIRRPNINHLPHLMQMEVGAKYHSGPTKVGTQKFTHQRLTKQQRPEVRICPLVPDPQNLMLL
jgi:hypothetical protein